ncbi:MAG: hypothetical protein AB1810_06965 [Pseudomonadota bacterium]
MSILSYDQAIAELKSLTSSGKLTLENLMDLGSRVSMAAAAGQVQGAVTLFFGSPMTLTHVGLSPDAALKVAPDPREQALRLSILKNRSIAMTFKNEYIPPLEQETSEFLKKARQILRPGNKKLDSWTVDRENSRVLTCSGRGREEGYGEEYWQYLDESGRYSFTTKKVHHSLISEGPPRKVAITRDILSFRGGEAFKGLPDAETMQRIKEAFQVYGRNGIVSQEKNVVCLHTLLLRGEAL